MEKYKEINGYEGLYKISNHGNIFSLISNKILKKTRDKKGYERITLHKDKKIKTFKVHRLVAQAFILNPENKPQVNHIDGIKNNNFDYNLEWSTNQENIIHAYANNLIKNSTNKNISNLTRRKLSKINAVKVNQISIKDNKIINTFDSLKEAAEYMNCNPSCIGAVCRGKHKTSKGFKWEFIEDENHYRNKKILQINPDSNKVINTFNTIKEVAKELNCSYKNVSDACNKRQKTCKGFILNYS